MLSDEIMSEIFARIAEKKISLACPKCPSGTLGVHNRGFFPPFISDNPTSAVEIGGEKSMLPCVVMMCKTCGSLSFHALEPLGLTHLFQG
jgi:hypothetical protein